MQKTLFFLLFISFWAKAQSLLPHETQSASDILLSLKKVQNIGKVLYIAAHPDDENTRLIAYLSKEKCFRTAYLSLTRGDGGQNLIGSQTGEYLGLIRIQELLQARKIDGAEQYFTLANDFGFSKNAEETLQLWDSTKVLADMVWVIRNFQPDIIITRFDPKSSGKTHGHHTASAILAQKAFHLAAQENAFPEQLKLTDTWQAQSLFWNVSSWFFPDGKMDTSQFWEIKDAGKYNFLLGKSYGEIATESRTMHQSQGMGRLKVRGENAEYLAFLDGKKPKNEPFEGIPTWQDIPNAQDIGKLLAQAYKDFDAENPEKIVPQLLEAYKLLEKLDKNKYEQLIKYKKYEIGQLLRFCSGLWFESLAKDYSAVAGKPIHLSFNVVKSGYVEVELKSIKLYFSNDSIFELKEKLSKNIYKEFKKSVLLKENLPISQAYWLENDFGTMYQSKEQKWVGLAETPSVTKTVWTFVWGKDSISFEQDLLYKWNEEVRGELYRKLEIVPTVTANTTDKILMFSEQKPKKVQFLVKNHLDSQEVDFTLQLGKNWKVYPEKINVSFYKKNEEKLLSFTITPPKDSGETMLQILGNGEILRSLVRIDYPHIPIQSNFPKAQIKAIRLDISLVPQKIGYFVGAGDEIAECLRQIGYEVQEITEDNFEKTELSQFGTIITGVRAYNIRKRANFEHERLLEYVKNGGNLIVQYNTNWGLSEGVKDIGVYPFEISKDRVTDENSEITFLDNKHEILNYPNKITKKDFESWIQERGIYFAKNWDSKYQSLISCQDQGEMPNSGGLIFASYGKGTYIYTGFSWFRQMPAGVAGAYRIFANLIAFRNKKS